MTKTSRWVAGWVLGILAAAWGGEASARVVYVDAASATRSTPDGTTWRRAFRAVQQGIAAAGAGDEVWVAAGVYAEKVALKDGVAVYGGFKATESALAQRDWRLNPTVLDGGGTAGSVVSVAGCPSTQTRLDGFRVQNGYANAGAGVYVADSNPVIANNDIRGNLSTAFGGNGSMYGAGLGAYRSRPRITGNTIAGNTNEASTMTLTLYGGGIYLESCPGALVEANTFSGNRAMYGGGIFVYMSDNAVVAGNTFEGNYAMSEGGAVSSYWSMNATVSGNLITSNSTQGVGGGGYTWGYPATFSNNVFQFNTAGSSGGGAFANTAGTRFYSNVFEGNHAYSGGGVVLGKASSAVDNNTFVGNTVTKDGGAVYVYGSGCELKNNIFSFADSGVFVDTARGASAVAAANLYFGLSLYDSIGIPAGAGDVLADPLFADLAAGDFHLTAGSPAVDAGDPSAVPSADSVDLDGEARVAGAAVDLGADEFHGDTTAPTAVSTSPADGATGVAVNATVSVVFSEDVVLGPSSPNIVLVDVALGTPVACSVAVAGRTLTLTPAGPLGRRTTYRVTVGASAVADGAGNLLPADVVFSFTTANR